MAGKSKLLKKKRHTLDKNRLLRRLRNKKDSCVVNGEIEKSSVFPETHEVIKITSNIDNENEKMISDNSMDWEYQEILLIKLVKQKGLHREDIAITPDERLNLWSEIAQRCMYSSAEETQMKWKSIRSEYEKDKSLLKYQHGILNFLDQISAMSKIDDSEIAQTDSDACCSIKSSTLTESSSNIICFSDNTLNVKSDTVIVSFIKEVEIPSTMDCNDKEATYNELDKNINPIRLENTKTIQQTSTLNLEYARNKLKRQLVLDKINKTKRTSQNSVISENEEVDSSISKNNLINAPTQTRKRKSQECSFDKEQETPIQFSKNNDNINKKSDADTDLISVDKSNNVEGINKESMSQLPIEMEIKMLIDDLNGTENKNAINKDRENIEVNENDAIDKSNIVDDINKESISQRPMEMETNTLMDNLDGKDNEIKIKKYQETSEDNEIKKEKKLMKNDIDEMENNSFYSTLSDLVYKLPEKQQKKLRIKIGMVIADAEIEMLINKMPE